MNKKIALGMIVENLIGEKIEDVLKNIDAYNNLDLVQGKLLALKGKTYKGLNDYTLTCTRIHMNYATLILLTRKGIVINHKLV